MRSIRCDEAYHFSAQVGDCFVGAGDKERLQHPLATTQERGLFSRRQFLPERKARSAVEILEMTNFAECAYKP